MSFLPSIPNPEPNPSSAEQSSAEVAAQHKHTCPACGGESVWNPAKQALVCQYCGFVSPATVHPATGEIQEHDLATALRNAPDEQRGWMTETRSVRCQSCQAVSVFPADRVAQRCEFCGSSELVPYEATRAPIRPESLLPFKITEIAVRESARQWYRTRWFAPNALKKMALTDQIRGCYLPYWTLDAQASCPWRADAGYYYYETESYTDSAGKSQTRQVQRTRWEPVSGRIEHFFNDELVAASRGIPTDLIRRIEPFPTVSELVPYDASYLSGWIVEQYWIDLSTAAETVVTRMHETLRRLCSNEVPGDTQRGLEIFPAYSERTFKHVLLPVWILSYNYLGKPYQMLINGYTGTLTGRYPKSWIKITALVLFIVALVLITLIIYDKVERGSTA